MTHDPELDLLLVGCGLRGTGLLSANPDLLAYRIGVIDAGEQPGPGNFPFYRIDSNSYGSDFFGWVDPQRVYGAALRDADVIALRESVGSFPLARLAQALRPFGAIIRRELGAGRVWLRRRAVRIDVAEDGVTVQLDDGSRVRSRLVVLATGIRERVHAELLPWRHKLLLSRQIIEHGPPAAWRDTPLRVHLLGGSHSAYAIARLLAEPGTLAAGSSVTLQHRGLVKLFYGSHEEYAAAEHAALEAVPDLERDRCPETGNVFRYSGLRHAARHTFREIAANRLAGFAQIRAARLGDAAPRLDEADCIVQALGYESNTLPLEVDGRPVPMCAPGGIVLPGSDGRLALPGIAPSPLFVMGMNPYPYDDNSLTPTGQYALRGAQVLRALREHARPAAAAALSDSPTHSAQ